MDLWQVGFAVVLFATPFMVASAARHYAQPELKFRAGLITFFWAAVPDFTFAVMAISVRY